MEFNWLNIRSYNNSQNNSFEELVCQLAREEEIDKRRTFYRVAAPDGGVEAYCVLESGKEYGWQAKFFMSMGTSQWQQLEESFTTAFEKHPDLIEYYVCIPLDRQDPRIPEQNWFMDKWNTKVKEWEEFARAKGRNITIRYWGSSELLHRLSLEKHAGRRHFWSNQQEFSMQWFKSNLERSIDALGERYTPEVNFELEIAKVFDGIAHSEGFKEQFDNLYDDFLKKSSKVLSSLSSDTLHQKRAEVAQSISDIETLYALINFYEMEPVDYQAIAQLCDDLHNDLEECWAIIGDIKKQGTSLTREDTERLDYARYNVRELLYSLSEFVDFLRSHTARLFNLPILVLSGEAGIGKSHLLADIARKRSLQGLPSILLLGQHFVSDEHPWTQILRNLLRLNCNETEFLGALNAKAQSVGSRLILFIDAINEGNGKYFWGDHIKSFIRSFQEFRWLGLVISVRTSYEKLLVPKESVSEDLALRLSHRGFATREYEASKYFFRNYNIEQHSIPLLHPEFQNPLFLKLFCDGLKKSGFTRIPDGYEGISTIIEFYLNSINTRLSAPSRLHYPKTIKLIQTAINMIVERKVEHTERYLTYEETFTLIEGELQKYSDKRRLLEELISEGILTKNLFWNSEGQPVEGIYLSFERFEDHLIVSFLLEKFLNKEHPEESFVEGQRLFEFVRDEHQCYRHKGIIEALSIQLPEKIGKELYEVIPERKAFFPVIDSFIDSLIWRKTETISEELLEYVNECVLKQRRTHSKFFDILLLISSNPKQYFNADFLHKQLVKYSLPDRDAWWLPYLHYTYREQEQSPVRRLIDWAWSEEEKEHICNESINLVATVLAWFLTSSNRFLRDSSTKALVALLQARIPILIEVLRKFESINDPYVYERLFAVAYGCALRSQDFIGIKLLSEYIYTTVFTPEYVYPHILLRDYARNTIEYALYKELEVEVDRIRPPYKSVVPEYIPENEEIQKLDTSSPRDDSKWGQDEILCSMQPEHSEIGMLYGDFGRYVFESAFRAWDLDPQQLSNVVVKRVFELGYDAEKHGTFARNVNRYPDPGRTGRKAERIGKKYQWIAFYELLAQIADNFPMINPWDSNETPEYQGAWTPSVRDIDPSLLIKSTQEEQYETPRQHWWFTSSYCAWDLPNEEWVKGTDDLPHPSDIIEIDDESGVKWLVLEVSPQWTEPTQIGQEKWSIPHKDLWYQIRSYLVHKDDISKWIDRMAQREFTGDMPKSTDWYQLYSREFYWSPGFKDLTGGEDWKEVYNYTAHKIIDSVIVTTERLLWEEEYDCSKDDTIRFYKLPNVIFQGMHLSESPKEAHFVNTNGEVVCFDPSVYVKSLSCLLIRKNDFLTFLHEHDLAIFWTVLGEKRILEMNWENYLGRLDVRGVYSLNSDSKLSGQLKHTFSPPK